MVEFNGERFCKMLKEAPPKQPFTLPATLGEYVVTHVIEPFETEETLNLKTLDFSAFSLEDIPIDYTEEMYQRISGNWGTSFHKRLRMVQAQAAKEKRYF